MIVHNLIDVRWHDGFGPIFTCSHLERDAIERVLAGVPLSKEDASLLVRDVEVGQDVKTVAVLRFDAVVGSNARFQTYVHAILVARAAIDAEAWQVLVLARYGPMLEDRLDELIQLCASEDRAAGQHLLEPLTFSAADVAEVTAARAATTTEVTPTTAQLERESVHEPRPRPSRAPRWPSLATAAVALTVAATGHQMWLQHRKLRQLEATVARLAAELALERGAEGSSNPPRAAPSAPEATTCSGSTEHE